MPAALERHRVFVYGSLLRGLHNHHCLKSATFIGAARTRPPYALVDSGRGYPYALDAARARGGVDITAPLCGEVYEVDDATLTLSLDPLEEHPRYYRRGEVALEGDDRAAWLYLLIDPEACAAIAADATGALFQPVDPPGDWRAHLLRERPAQRWPASRRTLRPGPHAVFSYGCTGVATLRERCGCAGIEARAAELRGAARVFGGVSQQWGGATCSVQPSRGGVVRGNLASLSDEQLALLDGFEGTHPEGSYSERGIYRRQDVTVRADGQDLPALVYVQTDTTWLAPPSQAYLDACAANLGEFWDEELSVVEVLDERGEPPPAHEIHTQSA